MHSSRMRTGCSLTICLTLLREGGIWVYPQRKQKSKKHFPPKKIRGSPLTPPTPPEKLDTPQNWRPPKIGDPLKNWRPPKIGDPQPPPSWDQTPPTPPPHPGLTCKACWDTLPPVDRHTLVKILPWPNFVAAGNKNAFQ